MTSNDSKMKKNFKTNLIIFGILILVLIPIMAILEYFNFGYSNIVSASASLLTVYIMLYSVIKSEESSHETMIEVRKQAELMKYQLTEMQEQRKPILKICETHSKLGPDSYSYDLCVKNVGFGPAGNIEIYFRCVKIAKNEEIKKLIMNIPALGKDEINFIRSEARNIHELPIPIDQIKENKFYIRIKTENLKDDTFWQIISEDRRPRQYKVFKIKAADYGV